MFNLKSLKYISVLAIVLIVGYGLYEITNLKGNLVQSEENNKKLTELVTNQENLITKLEKDIELVKSSIKSVDETIQIQNKELKILENKFDTKSSGQKRDFGNIAFKKPKLVQNIINKATKKANRCFEIASGAEIIQGEINSECQELIDNISN